MIKISALNEESSEESEEEDVPTITKEAQVCVGTVNFLFPKSITYKVVIYENLIDLYLNEQILNEIIRNTI